MTSDGTGHDALGLKRCFCAGVLTAACRWPMLSAIATLTQRFEQALVQAFGPELAGTDPVLVPASNPKFGDYQANCAMPLAKRLKDKPRAIAEKNRGSPRSQRSV